MNNHHAPIPSPACLAVAALLPVLDEPELDPQRVATARAHLSDCAYCRSQLTLYTRMDVALRQRFTATSTHHDSEDIMRSLSERSKATEDTIPIATTPRPRTMISRIAAIAAVLIVVTLAALITHSFIGGDAGAGLHNSGPPQTSFANTQGVFASISMVSPDEGWALAQITKTPVGQRSLHDVTLYHYHNGTWTPTIVTTSVDFATGGVGGFTGTISMDSATDGWAVAHNFNRVSVLLHYSGGQWTEVNVGQIYIAKVQALSPRSAWAIVGSQPNGATPLHYDGTTWRSESIIDMAAGVHLGFLDIDMQSASAGWVLAETYGANFTTHDMWRYKDGEWTGASTINTNEADYFYALRMVSSTEGWALGQETVADASGNTTHVPLKPLVYHYINGSWHEMPLPNLGNNYPVLNTITMRTANDGWITGETTSDYPGATTGNFRQRMFLLHYDGTRWQQVAAPPTGVSADGLTGLAITGAGTAWACGYANNIPSSKTVQDTDIMTGASPLLLRYQNGAWSIYRQ